ncbi:sensor histidine kinase [Pseudonocardia endophytica]|uniref:histidine kinase n=1 Tax=Pseudonocardia endophytica TaxID=401976 RepID=A0A4R1HQ76_PSEEN|nr:histidine kinase [Pseudonocardia endophytica]TCK22610.1 histidine kinase [Pseudonocardia endophytica]
MTWPRALSVLLTVLAVALVVGATALPGTDPVGPLLGVLLALPMLALGLVIAARRRSTVIGPLLCLSGFAACLNAFTDAYAVSVQIGADPPGAWLVVPLALQMAWMWWFVPLALLALYFPEGRLPSRRWRPVAVALPAVAVLSAALGAVAPGPFQAPNPDFPHTLGTLPDWTTVPVYALSFVFLGLLVAAAVALVRRRRSSDDPVRRAQLRWLALAGMWLPVTLLLCMGSFLTLGSPALVVIGLVGLYLSVPAATAVAMLRHDLYDVDRAFSVTLTWTTLAGALLVVYAAVAFAGGVVFGGESAPVAAAATAVCALALAPLRTRLQRRVDRRVYPERRAALAAVGSLRDKARDGTARPEQLQDALRAALRDPRLRVGYRPPGTDTLVDADGEPLDPGPSLWVPVLRDGREVGVLLRGDRGSRELLREIADAAGLLVEVVGLRLELNRAVVEAESSRARLLSVSYAERRRLERDLHDGAQQRLVSLGMSLRLAQRHLDTGTADGTVDMDGVLDSAVAELSTAVAELRQIANGLRPSCLDDGLGPALRSLTATTPLAVDLDVAPGEVPDDTATTAYYVASEALANAVKHASATRLSLGVAREEGRLRIDVRDDGRGGAAARPGGGLDGLADRVAAAGGILTVTSTVAGTSVAAELPCGS